MINAILSRAGSRPGRLGGAVLATLLVGLTLPIAARADVAGGADQARKLPFGQAPEPVRKGLLGVMAECGTPPGLVRSNAYFDVKSIGGAGSRDYYWAYGDGYWTRRFNAGDYPQGGRCTGNYTWFAVWMHIGGDRYKQFVMTGGNLVRKGGRYAIFNADCDQRQWSAGGRFVAWDPKAQSFRPITKCMKNKSADAWMKAHGYH